MMGLEQLTRRQQRPSRSSVPGKWPVVGWLLATVLAFAPCSVLTAAAQSYSQNEARLKEMTADQKEDLRRKKLRFDELGADEQQRLRQLHQSIVGDPNADELIDTVTRYNRWLANLDPTERSTLLDIKDPAQRIARIKELMQQQEKRRFDQYFANLPEEDRKTIFTWLGEFVAAHADAIRERLPPPVRQRIDDAPGEEAMRREIFAHWQRWRREFSLPFPSADDHSSLFKRFSAETQKTIDSSVANELSKEPEDQRTPERQRALQQQRLTELWRTALYSRFFPQISVDELLKYYAAMKPDDLRRKQLEGKEGDELRRELQRMYNWDHGFGRGGGSPGPQGGRGFGPGSGSWPGPKGGPRDGRGKPGDRFDEKDRGGKLPPPPGERPPANENPADAN